MNAIVKPITADGRTGFDEFNQLIAWTKPTASGMRQGRMIKDVRTCTCYICGKGWGNTTEDLLDQVAIEKRDMHLSCWEGHQKLNAYYDIQRALIDAGFLFSMEEVEPRYPYSTPWQRITVLLTEKREDSGFRIVLGRRKRVWELRVHNVGDLTEKFPNLTNTTMGYNEKGSVDEQQFGPYFYIHAWTKQEMVDYLKVFHAAIPAKIDRD